ncbi:MAG: BON domain-containing protein [Alphaproteobacteria bacterium]
MVKHWRHRLRMGAVACVLGAFAGAVGACSPVGLVVDAAGIVAEDRSTVDQTRDTDIRLSLNRAMLEADSKIFSAIGIQVWEGRVVLTGAVTNPAYRDRAVAIAKGIPNVKTVLNEIQVVADEGGLAAFATDTLIEERLKARLLLADGVQSVNYSIHAVNGVVYLLGVAHSQEEMDLVLSEARRIDSVKRVVNHVRVRPKRGS